MNERSELVLQDNASTVAGELEWKSLGVWTYIKILIIGGLIGFFFWEEIYRIVSKWVNDASWSHGFLIPVFSLYFLNQNKEHIFKLQPNRSYLGLLIIILCIVFYPINVVHFHIGYFNPLVLIGVLGGAVLFLGGWKLIRYCWLPIGYLIFAVPLPTGIYKAVTIPMRIFAAQIATVLLSFVPQLEANARGVVIDVVYKGVSMEPALDVAEACSGMRLLMAFMALGVAMAYLHYRPIWQRMVLLASTIPIAVMCNVIRVTVTGFIHILWDPRYAQGIWHDLLGMLMLPLAFGMYAVLAWIMSNLFVEQVVSSEGDVIVRRR